MKEQILELRDQGKTYNEIVDIVGCSKGTVSYYCGKGQKEKTRIRKRKSRGNKPLLAKLRQFKDRSFYFKNKDFKRLANDSGEDFTYEELLEKIGTEPKCYLTGREIDLLDTKKYHFDHIIPISEGGDNSLSNLGLTCKEANLSKNALKLEDYFKLCIEVLEHNGYKVSKI